MMMNSGDEQTPDKQRQHPKEDDDTLDFELEEVLDMDEVSDASDLNAIEGVEPLDFLDNEEEGLELSAPQPTAEPTIDFSAQEIVDIENEDEDELEFTDLSTTPLEEAPSSESVRAEAETVEELTFEDLGSEGDTEGLDSGEGMNSPELENALSSDQADVGSTSDGLPTAEGELDLPAEETAGSEDMFADIGKDQPSVTHSPEKISVSVDDYSDDAASASEESDGDQLLLRKEPETPAGTGPTIQSAPLSQEKPEKKKSSLPLVAGGLLVLLILAGGVVGGLYLAGIIPGSNENSVAINRSDDGAVVAPDESTDGSENDIVQRINTAEEQLRTIYQAAIAGDVIDKAKLDEGKALLDDLAANQPDVLAEEPIAQHKERFAQLAKDYRQQAEKEQKRRQAAEFRSALELAAAEAPRSLDQGLLEEAKRLAANDGQRQLIEELEKEVAEYQTELAAIAAIEALQKHQAAISGIVAAVVDEDPEQFEQQLAAYIAAYPESPRSADMRQTAGNHVQALAVIRDWNNALQQWKQFEPRTASPAAASQLLQTTESIAATLDEKLPGISAIQEALPVVKAIAAREQNGVKLVDSLKSVFGNDAIGASLILATHDGRRFYLASRPKQDGDQLACDHYDNLQGNKTVTKVAVADIDRKATGPATMATTAQAVTNLLASVEKSGWEPTFVKALMTVDRDVKLDPVIKTQWLVALAEVGNQGSQPMANATEDVMRLAETGINADFNWANPQAAAAMRAKCADALAKRPPLRPVAGAVATAYKALKPVEVSHSVESIGVLLRDTQDVSKWEVALAEGAPASVNVGLVTRADSESPWTFQPIGTLEEGVLTLEESLVPEVLKEGSAVFTTVTTLKSDAE